MADLSLLIEILGRDLASGPVHDVSRSLYDLERQSGTTHNSLAQLQTVMMGVGAVAATAVVGGFAASIGAAADFESKMNAVGAVSGTSGEELKQLSALALQLGKDTTFSASQAAEGLGELAKGGMSVADIMGGGAKAALDLAAAGGVSMADAAALAANAMAVFNLKGEDMGKVVDNIAGFANATTGSVNDFKFALASVGAVANLSNQDFEDTATAISLMGKAGILGSDAGTSLKTMLLNLQPTTNSAKAAFEELGIRTVDTSGAMQKMSDIIQSYGEPGLKALDKAGKDGAVTSKDLYKILTDLGDPITKDTKNFVDLAEKMGFTTNRFIDQEGHFKSLREIAGILQEGVSNLTDAEAQLALKAAFGQDAVRASAILAKEGANGFDEMAEAMNKVSANDVATQRLSGLNGAMEALHGSVETAAITFGQEFLPVLTDAVKQGTTLLNDYVIPWSQVHGPALAQAAREGATAFGEILGVIGEVLGKLGELTGEVKQHNVELSLLTGVIVSGTTAWALMEAGIVAAKIATIAMTVATEAQTAAQWLLNAALTANPIGIVVVAIAGLVAALVIAYNTNEDFRNAVNTAWEAVRSTAVTVFGVVKTLVEQAGQKFEEIGTAIQNEIAAWQADFPGKALQLGKDIIQGIINGLNPANLIAKMAEVGHDALEAGAKAVGAKSPSTEAARLIGGPIIEGIIMGLVDNYPALQQTAYQVGTGAVTTMAQGVNDRKAVLLAASKLAGQQAGSEAADGLESQRGKWSSKWGQYIEVTDHAATEIADDIGHIEFSVAEAIPNVVFSLGVGAQAFDDLGSHANASANTVGNAANQIKAKVTEIHSNLSTIGSLGPVGPGGVGGLQIAGGIGFNFGTLQTGVLSPMHGGTADMDALIATLQQLPADMLTASQQAILEAFNSLPHGASGLVFNGPTLNIAGEGGETEVLSPVSVMANTMRSVLTEFGMRRAPGPIDVNIIGNDAPPAPAEISLWERMYEVIKGSGNQYDAIVTALREISHGNEAIFNSYYGIAKSANFSLETVSMLLQRATTFTAAQPALAPGTGLYRNEGGTTYNVTVHAGAVGDERALADAIRRALASDGNRNGVRSR